MTQPPWQFNCHLILPHPTAPQLLLLPEAGGWALPSIQLELARYGSEFEMLREAAGARFGFDLIPLRRAFRCSDEVTRQHHAVYVLENRGAVAPRSAGIWCGRAQLAEHAPGDAAQRAVIEDWFAELDGAPVPALRRPWARPGWFAGASFWMEQQLMQLGYTLDAPVELFRSVAISAVLRAHTNRGDVYLKVAAELPLFGDEPALTRWLAARFPESQPEVLAIEPAERWLLMRDFGAKLSQSRDLPVWLEALRRFAQIQLACVGQTDALLAAGCLDRRLDRLQQHVRDLLGDAAALAELDPAEAERLRALEPQIMGMCAQLARGAVPQTLVHGDLHLGNIAVDGQRLTFFDWTDASIAHPFFDLATIFNNAEDMLGAQEQTRVQLRDEYLAAWSAYAPIEQLRELCALAVPLGDLHQAVSYRQLQAGTEESQRAEWDGATVFWLRRALAALPAR